MKRAQTFSQLDRNQREAVGLLQIGTFLEYFDLMLYVHMAVLLNELFFPKTDPYTTKLLAAFTFCSSYFFRPIGGLIFGWIGDNIGRRSAVIITVFIMSISCIVIGSLPTYEQIGISAAWIVTICRIAQGMACTGEVTGAGLYLTEMSKPPFQYPLVAMLTVCTAIGTTVALGVASLVTAWHMNWRIAFFIGAGIGLIGSIARTALKETPDFVDAKKRVSFVYQQANKSTTSLADNTIINEKFSHKTLVAFFFMQCTRPICFYFAYVHCSSILREIGLSAENVIYHNFIISIVDLIGLIGLALISYKIYPLKILKAKLVVFGIFLFCSPFLISQATSELYIGILQIITVLFAFDDMPAVPILYKHIPIFKRFTYASLVHAAARAFMYIIMSFGLVYLTEKFGSYGLLMIALPLSVAFNMALNHFWNLEKVAGNYP